MSRNTEYQTKAGHGRILDAWDPPPQAGEPVGCIATSFTFVPDFFETECLSRFLALDSDPSDGAVYFVEREERLAQLSCAAVLVDQHHVQGSRNLRWDLLAARVRPGILHSKISLLLWSNHARLIVASANLTPDGYRRNHEVFGVLDFSPEGAAHLEVLAETIGFLGQSVRFASADRSDSSPAIQRWNLFLDRVGKRVRKWAATTPRRRSSNARVFPILSGPGRPSVLRALKDLWPDASPPSRAYVVSPFFDSPEVRNVPARELWKVLGSRGSRLVQYEVVAEEVKEAGRKHQLLHAPETLLKEHSEDSNCEVRFQALDLEPSRPLHAKCLWLENRNWSVYVMGSSNFTSAGLGLGRAPNLEANLAYVVHHNKNPKAGRSLSDGWLSSDPVLRNFRLLTEPPPEGCEDDASSEAVLLPKQFGDALFGTDSKGEAIVELSIQGQPPAGWVVLHEQKEEALCNERQWRNRGRTARIILPWKDPRPPAALRVRWKGSRGCAWWPVNLTNSSALPAPEQLRELGLDDLVEILTSAGPLHRTISRLLRKRNNHNGPSEDILDPHRRVDTSQFLLQRTRRVTWALAALRRRLEQPVPSPEALHWRLHGPVGVMPFAAAIDREAKSEQERCFLLTELALELARVMPKSAPGCLARREIRAALRTIIRELRNKTLKVSTRAGAIRRYAVRAFKEAAA